MRNFGTNMTRAIPVPDLDFILFRVKVFFAPRQWGGFAKLETVVHPPKARHSRGKRSTNKKTRTPRGLQKPRVDIGCVNKEVRAEILRDGSVRDFFQILG